MEDIVNEVTTQVVDNRLEQTLQEFESLIETTIEEGAATTALENEHQEIPVNSQTIIIDGTTSRFSGAIWYEEIQRQTVTLAGVGGIGGFGNLINF